MDNNKVTNQIKNLAYENGADLVGFADLSFIDNALTEDNMKYGISVAIKIPIEVVEGIKSSPTMDYYNAYHNLNDKLDNIVCVIGEFLIKMGYRANAQTVKTVIEDNCYTTLIPHKTVATNAGLGWIGKCALLVTEEYGSAIRLSSIITNAVLECGKPITKSKCGECMQCTKSCPAGAVSGELWDVSRNRDEFFNPYKCRAKARERAWNAIGKEVTLCGKCIEVCPYTQRYLKTSQI